MYHFLPALLLLNSAVALATTVYKVVDDNGVVSFSDTPQTQDADVVTISAPPPQSPEATSANLEAMRETTDRMAEDRRERERHRAEQKALAASTAATQAPVKPIYNDDYYPVNSRSNRHHGRAPYHPAYRPKPEHPIIRPPLAMPDGNSFRPLNSQLMRPMLPRR